MAELSGATAASTPRLAGQMAAIARARWQLQVNSLRTTRGALEMISKIWVGLWFGVLGLGGAIGFGFAAAYWLSQGEGGRIAILLWGLFAFWQIFPLAAATFSEHVDASGLHRFPLSYAGYVVVRVAFGSFDAATLVGGLCMAGFVVGTGIVAPWLLPLSLLLALGFTLFNVVLAQMIFAWLERWLAKRRTREILALLFFLAIFSINFIGPLSDRMHGRHAALPRMLLKVQAWLPPGIPAHALETAHAAAWIAPLAGMAALLAWGAGVLSLLHVRLRAEYRGEPLDQSRRAARPAPARRAPAAASAAPPQLDLGAAGAIARKELRYLLRSPMMAFSLIMPVVLLLFFRFAGSPARHGRAAFLQGSGLAFPAAAAYALVILTNLVFNVFGTDATGVQFYFMAPLRFRQVLLGKNLAYGSLFGIEVALVYVVAAALDGRPAAWVQAATFIGLVFALFCDFACGNLLSLYMPKKIDLSRLGRQNARGTSALLSLGVQGVVAVLAAIAVLGGIVLHRHWLTLVVLAALAGLAGAGYWAMLGQSDRLAQAQRETLISELSKA